MGKKGTTLIELVLVTVILSIIAVTFDGLITQMINTGMFIMGKKESYQQAKEALKQMADEIRVNVRGGPLHNLETADVPTSSELDYYNCFIINNGTNNGIKACNASRFVFYPYPSDFLRGVVFDWRDSSGLVGYPSGWLLIRTEKEPDATYIPTVLARAADASKGTLQVRYFDDTATPGSEEILPARFVPDVDDSPDGVGLAKADAKKVTRIVLTLMLQQWSQPVTLSETIFVRQGSVPEEPAANCR